ncbi:MAG: hypothetical protein KatS3mg076_2155 [Candidatus Binatia bacterium]|nr:MAG: hypothetical protein KatS3mg076_2155 [Candidatus Binatia bacterium]
MDWATFVCLVLALVLVVYVAWPLRRVARHSPEASREEIERWERQKREAYEALRDAEFDYRMGKLDERDRDSLLARYRARALEAIAALERLGASASPESAPPRANRPVFRYCPGCGRKRPPGARFCPRCGTRLEDPAA